MAELVTIPISFIEIVIEYDGPKLALCTDRGTLWQAIFDALKPWGAGIDDVEIRASGKLSEQGITIKIPGKRVAFFFGPASAKFTRDDIAWDLAEETFLILDAALSTLVRFGGVGIASKNIALSLHVQPRVQPFMHILKPFVAPELAALDSRPIQTMASVAKWDKRKVTIDGSGALANGVFLKLDREFTGTATWHEIAVQLKRDEEELFRILGVEEDLS
jgi:hypothetical protein